MSAPNGGKVEGNFTAQELDSIMKNHENKFMKVSYYVTFFRFFSFSVYLMVQNVRTGRFLPIYFRSGTNGEKNAP